MEHTLIARLEAVTSRLEAVQVRLAGATPAVPSVPTPPADASTSDHPASASAATLPPPATTQSQQAPVSAYNDILANELAAFIDVADSIGGEILRASRVLSDAYQKAHHVLSAVAACRRPSDPSALQALLKPVADKLMEANSLPNTAPPRSPYENHFKLVAEAVQALSFLAYTGPNCGMHPPPAHVQDTAQATEFYANKVLLQWKAKEPLHASWVAAAKALLQRTAKYCSQYHPTGLAWNASPDAPALGEYSANDTSSLPNGTTTTAAASDKASSERPPPLTVAPGSKKSTPPPPAPPPPPPASLLQPKQPPSGAVQPNGATSSASSAPASASSGGDMSAVLAQLNRGGAVTAGLRKVTDDMKTKNRSDRQGAVPAESKATSQTTASSSAADGRTRPINAATLKASVKPARTECEQGRKWVVEHHVDNKEIVIDNTQPRQSVQIFNCKNCTVKVLGKVNAISLDGCVKTGLLFDSVVSICEIVNCQSVEVQCCETAPCVAIDKTDGCRLYVGTDLAQSIDVATAKSSEVNIVVLPSEGSVGEDAKEFAVPEQFVTKWRDGRWRTEPVAHSGG